MKTVLGPLLRNPKTGKIERAVQITKRVKQWELPEYCKTIGCVYAISCGCEFCRSNCDYWKTIEQMQKDGTLKFKWIEKKEWGFKDEVS